MAFCIFLDKHWLNNFMLFLKSIWLVVLQSTLIYCIISICLQSERFIIFQLDVNAFRLTPWSLANQVCVQTQHKCNWQDLSLSKSLTNYNSLIESFESLSQSPHRRAPHTPRATQSFVHFVSVAETTESNWVICLFAAQPPIEEEKWELNWSKTAELLPFPTGLTQPSTGCIYRNAVIKISRTTVTCTAGLLFAVSQPASGSGQQSATGFRVRGEES